MNISIDFKSYLIAQLFFLGVGGTQATPPPPPALCVSPPDCIWLYSFRVNDESPLKNESAVSRTDVEPEPADVTHHTQNASDLDYHSMG